MYETLRGLIAEKLDRRLEADLFKIFRRPPRLATVVGGRTGRRARKLGIRDDGLMS